MTQRPKEAVLITGASGFLANYLRQECRRVDLDVLGVDKNQNSDTGWTRFGVGRLESVDLEYVCDTFDVRTIFHLAGGASVSHSMQYPVEDLISLLPGTAAIAQFARQRRATLVMFSSAAVYGNPTRLPVTEDDDKTPISPYGVHKLVAEELVQNYSRLWDLPVRIIRIFSAYGPGLRKQIFWDVAMRAIACMRCGETSIRLFGTGKETRDFLHGSDVARAAILASKSDPSRRLAVFNVASGRETNIESAVSTLLAHMGIQLCVEHDGVIRAGDPMRWRADITRLKELGFEQKINIDIGLQEVAHWINEVQRNAS